MLLQQVMALRYPGCLSGTGSVSHIQTYHGALGIIYRYAACTRGGIYSWGRGRYGALGHDDNEKNHPEPTRIQGLKAGIIVRRIACGRWHCIVLTNRCRLLGWGRNHAGQLGLGFVSRACTKPVIIELEPGERRLPSVRDVATGIQHPIWAGGVQ